MAQAQGLGGSSSHPGGLIGEGGEKLFGNLSAAQFAQDRSYGVPHGDGLIGRGSDEWIDDLSTAQSAQCLNRFVSHIGISLGEKRNQRFDGLGILYDLSSLFSQTT